jgi:NhaP-type Na+/H+ or K+/H+ antiporter
MSEPTIFFTGVIVLGILAQWLAWRLRLPSILLLLVFGFCAGRFANANSEDLLSQETLFSVVSLSVAIILFEGGLTLQLHELREAGKVVFRLVTVGALVTWLLTSISARLCVGMNLQLAALVGAILVVTGPTVIGPLLRQVKPVRRVSSIVKWEGIVIDPIGAVLAVLVFEAIRHVATAGELSTSEYTLLVCQMLGKTILVSVTAAIAAAVLLVQMMRRFLIPDFLNNSVSLAVAIAVFSFSNLIQEESGLVTVTLLGVCLANQKQVPLRHVIEFKEHLRVLLISCLFIVLAARIDFSDIVRLGWGGLWFVVCLVLIVRPASVLVTTLGTELSRNERIFLAFLAPRGIVAAAVSSVFALKVVHAAGNGETSGAEHIVPLTFLVIVATVALYGLTAAPLARRLGLAIANPQGVLFAGAASWIRSIAQALQDEGFQVLLVDTNYNNTAAARMAGLPVVCASVLSEFVEEEIELGSIGRLLALTPNDNLNSLAAMEFATVFGRAEVYQLSPAETASSRRGEHVPHIHGRFLFADNTTHGQLSFRFAGGSQVKRTKLTEEFGFDDFLRMYGSSALVLFVKDEQGRLLVATTDTPLRPTPGQTVIALVDIPDAASATA